MKHDAQAPKSLLEYMWSDDLSVEGLNKFFNQFEDEDKDELVRILSSVGHGAFRLASHESRTSQRSSPHDDLSKKPGNPDILKIFIAKYTELGLLKEALKESKDQAIRDAARGGSVEMVKLLLNAYLSFRIIETKDNVCEAYEEMQFVNAGFKAGLTGAAENGKVEVVKLILSTLEALKEETSSFVAYSDGTDLTPAFWGAITHIDVVKVLVSKLSNEFWREWHLLIFSKIYEYAKNDYQNGLDVLKIFFVMSVDKGNRNIASNHFGSKTATDFLENKLDWSNACDLLKGLPLSEKAVTFLKEKGVTNFEGLTVVTSTRPSFTGGQQPQQDGGFSFSNLSSYFGFGK